MAATAVFAQQELLTFEVGGSEKSYNQVKVVNETSKRRAVGLSIPMAGVEVPGLPIQPGRP